MVIYDAAGYAPLREFLLKNKVRHVLLTGYATDMCFCKTTAGYQNLAKDFNVFLVGDATLATFPANSSPRFATNAAISFASLSTSSRRCRGWSIGVRERRKTTSPPSPLSEAERGSRRVRL